MPPSGGMFVCGMTIGARKTADLVLIDGDPTTDIADLRNVALVIKRDTAYYPSEIDTALGIAPFAEPVRLAYCCRRCPARSRHRGASVRRCPPPVRTRVPRVRRRAAMRAISCQTTVAAVAADG